VTVAAHRQFVAHGASFDTGAEVFRLLLDEGLKEDHFLLDFGAGCLRVGRFLLMYLNVDRYYAVEPNRKLFEVGVECEVGQDLLRLKGLTIAYNDDFDAGIFGIPFDYILISGILAHTDHSQMRRLLQSTKAALASNGKVVASYHPEGNPHHVLEGWLYPNVAPHPKECILEAAKGLQYRELGLDDGNAMWCVLE